MVTFREALTDADREWIAKQKVFFVSTAPLDKGGNVNSSPKGYNSMAILSGTRVLYLDGRGSGCETISHLRENKRITIMFCAFEGPPRIVRLFGIGTVHEPGSSEFDSLFEEHYSAEWSDPGRFKFVRSIIDIKLHLVSQSCGYAVPVMEFKTERSTLVDYMKNKSTDALVTMCVRDNTLSIDGVPSFLNGTDPGSATRWRSLADSIVPWVGGAALGAAAALVVAKHALK
ncbi:hypothetical protein IWW38_000841 [Coemansia aciculifera]|uniref:Uncharacterized protein n=1 Tax=Coemansia aciculifera TaxID=417176 RepID=A0ACC1M8C8_9FUNG|nr:hypothetical protein IWW38_000841 [Coemansia aciculifera]